MTAAFLADMPALFIVFILAVVTLMIWGVIYAAKAKKKRQMALQAWATSNGWHYTPEEVSSIDRRFPEFGAFQQGSNRYGYNVMRGLHEEDEAWAMDYHYETYSTDSKGNRQTHHHHFSAVVLDSGLRLTPLSIREEGWFDKMKGVFGADDIDFESAEFSREFWVKSPSKRWAYDVIHQETMELLLGSPRFTLEFADRRVMAGRSRRFKPYEFNQALRLLSGVLQRIPKDIQKRLRT